MFTNELRTKVKNDILKMTLKEKIGQLIVVGFTGYEVNENLLSLIKDYKVANVILFTRNIKDIKQVYTLTKRIHEEVIKSTNTIPLISIDQEGGMVTRIMDGITFCPGNMTLSSVNDPIYTKNIGRIMGEELRCLGINMNFAPSLDVNNNPNNPVIGVRSYSDNPHTVAIYGGNFIEGIQESGVIATAKHFPGHGDTDVDSHLGLPIVNHSKERLDEIELVPFKENIKNIKAIMTAHILFKSYDDSNVPGTLSKKILTNLLRGELGFEGLIVSDCMEMKAIDEEFGASEGSVMGLKAGLDQALISHTYEKQKKALDLVYEAVCNGTLSEEEVDKKVERILLLKEENKSIMEKYFYNREFVDIEKDINLPINYEYSLDIVKKSLTLVKGKNINPYKKTLVIATEPFATTIAEDDLGSRSISTAIRKENVDVVVHKISAKITDGEINEILVKAKNFEQIVACTYNAYIFKNQVKLIQKLNDFFEDVFVLSTRSPFDIQSFPYIKNYLCLYEYTPNSAIVIAKYLKGEIIPAGKLPIKLESKIDIGASIYVGLDDYSLNDNIKYLLKLKQNGINKVFISAHMPEMRENFRQELIKICDFCKEQEIKIILDVSKPMLKDFEIPNIYALRIDYGFTIEEIVNMYYELEKKKIKIELNASIIKEADLEYIKQKGIDLCNFRISHNFYPKLYTGLSCEEVLRRNAIFKKYGMKIMMYIPSSFGKRPPMYEGLASIEEHRTMPLEGILSSIRALNIDEVFFGDAYVSEWEMKTAVSFNFDLIQIPIQINKNLSLEEKELLERKHTNRIDQPNSFIRSSCRKKDKDIKANNTEFRSKGSITIDNVMFKRYQGEVCIMLCDLPKDSRVNVVGKVLCNDFLLKSIKPGMSFRFVIKEVSNEK